MASNFNINKITLDNNSESAEILIGNTAPTVGPISADPGSLFIVANPAGSSLYINTSATTPGTTWTLFGLAGAGGDHQTLANLAWTSSLHTGTPGAIAAFNGTGVGVDLTGLAGQILYHDGSAWVVLAAGSAGEVLEINGSGLPSWAAPSSGTVTDLQTAYDGGNAIVTTSATDIDFTLSAAGGGFTVNGDGAVSFGATTEVASFVADSSGFMTLQSRDDTLLWMQANDIVDKTLTISATNAHPTGEGRISISSDSQVDITDGIGTLTLDGGALSEAGMTSVDLSPSGAVDLVAGAASQLTTSAGVLTLDGADGINIQGNAAEIDLTTAGPVDINSGAGTWDASTLDITATSTVDVTGTVVAVDSTAGDITLDAVGGGISLDGAAASNFTTSAGALTLDGNGGVNIAGNTSEVDITTTGAVDVNAGIVTVDSTSSISIDAAAASNFTTSVGAVTINGADGINIEGNSSEIDLTTTGAVDINAGTVEIDSSSTFSIDGVGASNVTTDGGSLTLSTTTSGAIILSSSNNIDIDAVNGVTVDGSGASSFTVDSGNLTISTTNSGTVVLQGIDPVEINRVSGLNTEIVKLTQTTGGSNFGIFAGTADPSGIVTADAGDLFIRVAGSSSEMYQNTSSPSGTTWSKFAIGVDLQAAYLAGNTITTSAAEGSVIISGDQTLQVTTSAGLDVDTIADFDVTQFDVQMTGTNGFSIDGTDASNVTADSGNLTLSTTTSGEVLIDGVDGVEVNSSAGAIDIGNDVDNGDINIGTGTTAGRTITLGNNTGTTNLALEAGTGGVLIDSPITTLTGNLDLSLNNIQNVDNITANSGTFNSYTATRGQIFYAKNATDPLADIGEMAAYLHPIGRTSGGTLSKTYDAIGDRSSILSNTDGSVAGAVFTIPTISDTNASVTDLGTKVTSVGQSFLSDITNSGSTLYRPEYPTTISFQFDSGSGTVSNSPDLLTDGTKDFLTSIPNDGGVPDYDTVVRISGVDYEVTAINSSTELALGSAPTPGAASYEVNLGYDPIIIKVISNEILEIAPATPAPVRENLTYTINREPFLASIPNSGVGTAPTYLTKVSLLTVSGTSGAVLSPGSTFFDGGAAFLTTIPNGGAGTAPTYDTEIFVDGEGPYTVQLVNSDQQLTLATNAIISSPVNYSIYVSYPVSTVDSDTQLTLAASPTVTGSGLTYDIFEEASISDDLRKIDVSFGVGFTMIAVGFSTHAIVELNIPPFRRQLIPAEDDLYVYYNRFGQYQTNSLLPSNRTNIILGRVITDANEVAYIEDSRLNAHHMTNYHDNMFRNAIGAVVSSGGIIYKESGAGTIAIDAVVGTGYVDAIGVPTTGGTGSGLTVDITTSGGDITGAVINSPGINYTAGDSITIDQSGYVTAIPAGPASGGSGYTNATNVPTTGGTGSGLTVDITTVTGGVISSLAINNPGAGYTLGDTFSIIQPGGSGGQGTVSTVSTASNTETFTISDLNDLELSITACEYYYSTSNLELSSARSILWDAYYYDSTSTYFSYAVTPDQDQIDINYDDGSGTLATVPVSEYKKDLILGIETRNGDNLYILVYSTATYGTQAEAELAALPSVPTFAVNTFIRLASIVTENVGGSPVIRSILDERPRIGFASDTVSQLVNVNHSQLVNLGNDDHTQYLLVDGTRSMTGSLSLADLSPNIENSGASGITISSSSGDITIDGADSVVIDGAEAVSDAVRINASDAAGGIDIDAGTGGIDILTTGPLTADSSGQITIGGTNTSAPEVRVNAGANSEIVTLTQAGTGGESFGIYAGTTSPNLSVNADAGSLFVRDTGSGAELYQNISTGGSGTDWSLFSGGGTLTGNTIWVDAVNGDDPSGVRGEITSPFLTISAAIAASSPGDTIQLLPGSYPEDGLNITGISLIAVGGWEHTVVGPASGSATDDVIILGAFGYIEGISFNIPSTSGTPSSGGATREFAAIFCNQLSGTNSIYNIALYGNGSTANGEGIYRSGGGKTIGQNIRVEGGGISSCLKVDQGVLALEGIHVPQSVGAITNTLLVTTNTYSASPATAAGRAQMVGFNVGNSNVTNAVRIDSGTSSSISPVALIFTPNIFNCTNAVSSGGEYLSLSMLGGRFESLSAYSVVVDFTASTPGASFATYRINSNHQPDYFYPPVVAAESEFSLTYTQEKTDVLQSSFNIFGAGQLSVGFVERGTQTSLGRGRPFSNGMVILQSDSGGTFFNDITQDALSTSGSFVEFYDSGTSTPAADEVIYFGSLRQSGAGTPFKFWGFDLEVERARSGGEYVFEIWDGVDNVWKEITTQATSEEFGYSYGKDFFSRAESDEIIRFGLTSDIAYSPSATLPYELEEAAWSPVAIAPSNGTYGATTFVTGTDAVITAGGLGDILTSASALFNTTIPNTAGTPDEATIITLPTGTYNVLTVTSDTQLTLDSIEVLQPGEVLSLTLGAIVGTGYTTDTDVPTTTTGSGSGLTVDITASGGNITGITINNPGDGYSVGDVVTVIQAGSSNNETATVTSIQNSSLKYRASKLLKPIVGTSREDGSSNATGLIFTSATADFLNEIPNTGGTPDSTTTITINPSQVLEATLGGVTGTGYSTAIGVPTSGGSGSGLTFDITAAGDVTAVTINDPGTGYVAGDIVTITQGGGASDDETVTIDRVSRSGDSYVITQINSATEVVFATPLTANLSNLNYSITGSPLNAYWIRARVVTAPTTSPSIEYVRLLESAFNVSVNGVPSQTGLAKLRSNITVAGKVWSGIITGMGATPTLDDATITFGGAITPFNQEFNVSEAIDVGDSYSIQFTLPLGLCTAFPIKISAAVLVDNDSAGATRPTLTDSAGAEGLAIEVFALPQKLSGTLVSDPAGSKIPSRRSYVDADIRNGATREPYNKIFDYLPEGATFGVTSWADIWDKVHTIDFAEIDISDLYAEDIIVFQFRISADTTTNLSFIPLALFLEGVTYQAGKTLE